MPKVSYATSIDVGLGGPKVRPKGVTDGQQVNIPAPVTIRLSSGGTQEDSRSVPIGHGTSPNVGEVAAGKSTAAV